MLNPWPSGHTSVRPGGSDLTPSASSSCAVCALSRSCSIAGNGGVDHHADIRGDGRSAVPDNQVEDHARHFIGPHVYPHVWLRAIYAQLPLDLRLLLGRARSTLSSTSGLVVVLQRRDSGQRGHGSSDSGHKCNVVVVHCRIVSSRHGGMITWSVKILG